MLMVIHNWTYFVQAFKIIDDLYERTRARDTDTPNESQFSKQNANAIEHALTIYRANRLAPRIAWEPFEQVYGSFVY